jgi:hypothetical protein
MKQTTFFIVAIMCTVPTVCRCQILSDGDLDGLSIGTNPDVGMPAGAWSFIDSPETTPDQMSIVATETFNPGSSGNSLKMDIDDVNSIFLHNVFNEVIPEMPQRIVRTRFDIFVPPGPRGGGSVYVGQGEGTGSLRGPQLSWFPDGSIQYWASGTANFVAVPSYPRGIWQTVELDIDLVADKFDMSWGTMGSPVQQIQQGLPFRSGPLELLDRFVFFRVGNPALSYLDNVEVRIVSSGDFDSDGDFDCDDIDALVVEIVAGTHQVTFDMTGDNLVDLADRDAWLAAAGAHNLPSGNPYLHGDANLDGSVDGSDFGVWNANKFTGVAAWCSGDFTADGVVDGSDFGIWNAHKFQSADGVSAVPEPGVAALLVFALAKGLRLRRGHPGQ